MGRIVDWNNGNELFIFVNTKDILETSIIDKNHGWITDSGLFCITINNEKEEYQFEEENTIDYCTGDIVSVAENGFYRVLHDVYRPEVDIFVTNQCNSNCIMCPLPESVRRQYNKTHMEWLDKYIDYLPEGIRYINVTGGEPTLAKDAFLETMTSLRKKFLRADFQLLTNGRSLADIIFLERVIESCPSGIRFAIPIHSSNPDIHDAITRTKGSFLQTDCGINN